VAPMRATRDYQALLSGLDEERYARAVVGLWVLERVNLEGLALRRVVRWGGALRRGGGALDRPLVRVVCGSA
jgi:hypothetical protein